MSWGHKFTTLIWIYKKEKNFQENKLISILYFIIFFVR